MLRLKGMVDNKDAPENCQQARHTEQLLNTRIGATGCEDCVRLWDEFKSATHDYYELDHRFDIARYARDQEVVKLLQSLVPTKIYRAQRASESAS
jgi:hypothetical protein